MTITDEEIENLYDEFIATNSFKGTDLTMDRIFRAGARAMEKFIQQKQASCALLAEHQAEEDHEEWDLDGREPFSF